MKNTLCYLLFLLFNVQISSAQSLFDSNVVADEGAWCWFADPRALHYENEVNSINATYIGYIDVHGNIKATQYDWITKRKTDVLVRSFFQPDDHNNPTFLVLPDERIMIFYTRHTDEPRIWYRISTKPGDITALGEEKYLSTANNTTYPSPFIMSDDPNHIYLCWRGINWHPTIARLTMPDANDNCTFDFGPKQIVQSTGARPYAKYQSNGKDKIYLAYTTGHPDNEMPDWLYFNVIDINKGNGPLLKDINGKQLSTIANGPFNVSKNDSYYNSFPLTVVDKSANIRNWVWQISTDKNENPVIAYPHIDNAKTSHVYWYSRWTGSEWRNTWVQYAGHAFHQNWNSTERCYSGGMAIDPDNINDLYLSIPTSNGEYNKDGVFEIWKYTIDDDGNVSKSEQITSNSEKNNIRPFIIPGSKNSPLRLTWMNGDYYYWIVIKNYPLGYPTAVLCDYNWQEEYTKEASENDSPRVDCICLEAGKTLNIAFGMNSQNYSGKLFQMGVTSPLVYTLDIDGYPVVSVNGKEYKSQNRLYTSDDWATMSSGTGGDSHPTKLTTWVLTMTYDGKILTLYRNGLVDQVIEIDNLEGGTVDAYGDDFHHSILMMSDFYACASPQTVMLLAKRVQDNVKQIIAQRALETIILPEQTHTDLVLPKTVIGQQVTWSSSDNSVISDDGALAYLTEDKEAKLKATSNGYERTFDIICKKRDIKNNLRFEQAEILDLSANTLTGFNKNKYGLAPQGLLNGLRSYTFLVTVKAKSLEKQPRIYDFGSGSANSLFLRANPLAAGIKYNGGTTTMVNGSITLSANKEYKIAVSYSAATHTTKIYIDGEENASGTQNQNEPYMLCEAESDSRNYIGRTQWWDSSFANDNADFIGTISGLKLYDACLTKKEICDLQSIQYEEENYPSDIVNGDFEDEYSVQSGSGVSADRAIYVPKGWTVNRISPDNNDITALKSGDLYFDRFFGACEKPHTNGKQTYWIRQNWGTPTLVLQQTIKPESGKYILSADVWCNGEGGDARIGIEKFGNVSATSINVSKAAWQNVSFEFDADGENPVTVRLEAVHTTEGKEKIIGFDNIVLKSISPVLTGDVNFDDKVNISDVVAVINHIAGIEVWDIADINGDDKVNITDVVDIINIIANQ